MIGLKLMSMLSINNISDLNLTKKENFQKFILDKILTFLNWDIAHIYLVNKLNYEELINTNVWVQKNDTTFQNFKLISKGMVFRKDMGIPGKVLSENKYKWITDLSRNEKFLRNIFIQEQKIQTGLFVPFCYENQIIAVLEFFSQKLVDEDIGKINEIMSFLEEISESF